MFHNWDDDSSADNSLIDEDEPGLWTRTSFIQIIYGLWANQVTLCSGLAYGFSAVTVPQLKASTSQSAWVASVIMLTSSIGCIFCGYTLDHFGRRNMMVICMAPMAVGWFMTGMAEEPRGIIYGRIITGIGIGMAATPPRTYCTEIALPKMRGVLGALPTLALSVGIFVQAFLSLYCSWKLICHVCGAYATLTMVTNMFLPESPYYVLLSKDDMFDTRKALIIFRGRNYDFEPELQILIDYKSQNRIRKLSLMESVKLSFNKQCVKPFSILMVYCIVAELSGAAVIKFWSIDMLTEFNVPAERVYRGNLAFGITRIFAAALVVVCIFYMRRRPMAIASAIIIALLSSILSMYLITETHNSFIPKFGFMLLIVAGTFGPYTLPMLMLFEIIPLEVRGFLGSIGVMIHHLIIFAVVKIFPYLSNWIGYMLTIFCFGMVSFVSAIFLYFMLPETKGLPLPEIEAYIESRRKRLNIIRDRLDRRKLKLEGGQPRVSFKSKMTIITTPTHSLSTPSLPAGGSDDTSNNRDQNFQTDQTNQTNLNV